MKSEKNSKPIEIDLHEGAVLIERQRELIAQMEREGRNTDTQRRILQILEAIVREDETCLVHISGTGPGH